jgi:cation transport regulator ChaB
MKRLLKVANAETIINKIKNLLPNEKEVIKTEALKDAKGWIKDNLNYEDNYGDTKVEEFFVDFYEQSTGNLKNLLKRSFNELSDAIDSLTESEEDTIWDYIADIFYKPIEELFNEEIEQYKEDLKQGNPNEGLEQDYWKNQGI